MKYRRKAAPIDAVRLPEAHVVPGPEVLGFIDRVGRDVVRLNVGNRAHILTPDGTCEGRPGDWLISERPGIAYACPDEIFRNLYVPAD